MKKRLFSLALAMTLSVTALSGCNSGGQDNNNAPADNTEQSASDAPAASTNGEEREPALQGERVTPENLTVENFPGLTEIGVAPEKQYFIAYSNGEDSSDWCRALEDDMLETAQKYTDSYGIRFEYTSAGNDSTKQLSDIQSLIAMKPDLLIVMPNEAEPLTVVKDWCEEAGIALMTINNQINATPGEGAFVCEIAGDFYLNGIWHAMGIIKALEEENGEAKGDIAEIAGTLGASPAILRGQAARYVFDQYPDVNIVISRPGEWDATTTYSAIQDVFTVYQDGTLDAVIGGYDDGAIAISDVAKELGRTDIGNRITGNDGSLSAIKAILDGDILVSPETTPLYATFAFEYAIQYLNGTKIPASVSLPQRIYMAETPEQVAALEEIVKYCEANNTAFAPVSMGYYDVFPDFNDEVKALYPKNYKELDPNDTKYFPEPWTESASTIR